MARLEPWEVEDLRRAYDFATVVKRAEHVAGRKLTRAEVEALSNQCQKEWKPLDLADFPSAKP